MYRTRHRIPLYLGILALVLSVSLALHGNTVFKEGFQAPMNVVNQTIGPINLEAGVHYDLRVGLTHSSYVSVGFDGTLRVSVDRIDDDTVFEFEDDYWSQSGTWHEDGESGTWYENNTVSEVYFRAPESGTYSVKVKGAQRSAANTANEKIPFEVTVTERYASAGPFFFTGALLLVISGFLVIFRGHAFAGQVGQLKVGDVLKVRGTVYTVETATVFVETSSAYTPDDDEIGVGVELLIRGRDGACRYLCVEIYERIDSEGDEVDYRVIVVRHEVNESELKKKSANRILFDGQKFTYDQSKSGPWYSIERLTPNTRHRGTDRVYVSGTPGNSSRLDEGERILTLSTDPDGSEEWSVGEVVGWKAIHLPSELPKLQKKP